ncbi:MAG: tetratricopeptide repeat protein [Deltaproteobacteria bacterium]|nr:tetratricopeptide repeat protein [Deltaproteobacteria bacterium]
MNKSRPDSGKKAFFIKYRDVWGCLFLVVITLTAYWSVQDYDFVNFDDGVYVTENPHIQEGLTLKSVIWAFSFSEKEDTYWHPVTWLSHALDCQLYGLQSGKHHLTNLMFHIANSLLLFMVFKWMTGAFWRSAFVATIFAIHPINVDSVAWVAERKNVVSTFFWMLTMLSYVYYTKKPALYRYLLTFLLYVLGLLTKPTLVTLPFVLLLLDYWPLKRFFYGQLSRNGNGGRTKTVISGFKGFRPFHLIVEKTPFFILSGLSIALSSLSVQEKGSLASLVPMDLRISNALVSYVKYIGNMIWPQGLTVFYPYPRMVPAWETIGALFFLVCVSVFAIRLIQRAPYFIIGWLWFLGTLVPVLGLVQVGLWPAMADRFAYVPLIGLFMVFAWGVPQLCQNWSYRKIWLSASVACLLLVLITVTWKQVGYWENSITLFAHNLRFTSNNHIAHNNLGIALDEQDRTEESIEHYLQALRINPDYDKAHNNLGFALDKQGSTEEAIEHYLQALRINPDYDKSHYGLGLALDRQGRTGEAVEHYLQALRINPDYDKAHNNLGFALEKQGRTEEAIEHYLQALRINPDYDKAHNNLGLALDKQGRTEEAVEHYLQALRIQPDFAEAHYNLGNALGKQGRTEEAIEHYFQVLRIKPDFAEAHNNLGNAMIKQGRTEEAIEHYLRALRIQPDYAEAHYNLGNVLKKQGRTEEAIEHYLQALRIKPDFADAHNNLGVAMVKQGRIEEGVEHYLQALRINPDFAEAHNNLAIALFHKGNVEGAIAHFRKVLLINPNNSNVKSNLDKVLIMQQMMQQKQKNDAKRKMMQQKND